MKKLTAFVLMVLLISCGHKTPNEKRGTTLKPDGVTEVKFDKDSHNFGKLKDGEIVVYSFFFTNTGNKGYLIDYVETDCGCTKVNFEKKIIAPGKKGKIEVELNTAGMTGREYKTIEVHGNSKELKHLAIFADVDNEFIEIKY